MAIISPSEQSVSHHEKQHVSHHNNMSKEHLEISELEAQKQQDHIDSGNYQRAAPVVDEALRKRRARIT